MTGYGITDEKRVPITVGDNLVECVEQFPYLGSLVSYPVGGSMPKLNVELPMLAGPLVHYTKRSSMTAISTSPPNEGSMKPAC